MELHQLRCFVAVAEELHFGRAARRLDMLPSALGRHIRLLEEALGTRLLLRTTRNVTLTQDGIAFFDEARSLLAKADELGRRFRERGRKTLPGIESGRDRYGCCGTGARACFTISVNTVLTSPCS